MTEFGTESGTSCGFIAVLGAPNAGKSTLINRMVGAKVTIVTPKVQTTRIRVLGITIHGPSQLIFIDTPGIFKPRRRLDRAMVAAAWKGAADADRILLLVDAKRGIDDDTSRIVDGLEKSHRKAILGLNKVDLIPRERLLEYSAELNARGIFTDTFMISALTGDGVDDLMDFLSREVPAGPWLFPEDQLSDLPQRLMAAEVTRERLFVETYQEVPYSATVETEDWQERDDGSVRIEQTVYVQRATQKGIVLGKGGQMIKLIGAAARAELEEMYGRKIHLFLHVKVRPKWMEDRSRYTPWGLDFNA